MSVHPLYKHSSAKFIVLCMYTVLGAGDSGMNYNSAPALEERTLGGRTVGSRYRNSLGKVLGVEE